MSNHNTYHITNSAPSCTLLQDSIPYESCKRKAIHSRDPTTHPLSDEIALSVHHEIPRSLGSSLDGSNKALTLLVVWFSFDWQTEETEKQHLNIDFLHPSIPSQSLNPQCVKTNSQGHECQVKKRKY